MPVFQTGKYVEKCILSIINQTYKNLELIIVDDGSTDNSSAICEKYANIDSRIKLIRQRNKGLSGARNTGIDAAKGDFISFIDSDDYIEIQMMDKLYSNIIKYDSDICCCGVNMLYEDNNKEKKFVPNVGVFSGEAAAFNLFSDRSLSYAIVCNKLFKKSLFDNIRFKEKVNFEDEDIIHKLYLNSKKIVFIADCLYCYVKRGDSITLSYNPKKNIDKINILAERCDYICSYENAELLKYAINDFAKTYAFLMIETNNEIVDACKRTVTEFKEKYYDELSLIYRLSIKNPNLYLRFYKIECKFKNLSLYRRLNSDK